LFIFGLFGTYFDPKIKRLVIAHASSIFGGGKSTKIHEKSVQKGKICKNHEMHEIGNSVHEGILKESQIDAHF